MKTPNVKLLWLFVVLSIISIQVIIFGGCYISDWCVWGGLGGFFVSIGCLAKAT